MDTLNLIGAATGLGFLAGLRLYATILTLGLAIRFNLIDLRPEFAGLEVLSHGWVIGLAGIAFLLEFIADKIPWVDSAWDSVHTFIRPVGAAFLALTALGEISPMAQVTIALMTGGAALTSHSMKAATRLAVNQSPEPASNFLVSLAGDAAVPVGVWVAMEHPLLIGAFVAAATLIFLSIAPRVIRLLRIQFAALAGLFRGLARTTTNPDGADTLPDDYVRFLERELGKLEGSSALRAVAGSGVDGLKNSIGYLVLRDRDAVFVTRRWFRFRIFRIDSEEHLQKRFRKGLLLDRLVLTSDTQTHYFSVFKDVGAEYLWGPATP